jgi:serine/threonine protein kinase
MNETWLFESLGARVAEKGPRPIGEVARIVAGIARDLGRAHVQKRGHGAVCPAAVALYRRPRERAFRIELRAPYEVRREADAWAAPEGIVSGHRASPRADVWALGLVAYFALTGRPYFEAGETVSLLRQILAHPLPRPSARVAAEGAAHHLFDGFDGWFSQCVARDPRRRFATAPQAAAALIARLRSGSAGARLARSRPRVRAGDLTVAG